MMDVNTKRKGDAGHPLLVGINGVVKATIVTCGAMVLLGFVARHWWLAEIAASLRIQWLFASCCCGIVMAIQSQWDWFRFAAMVAFCTVPPLFNGYSADHSGSESEPGIRVGTFNVLSSNRRLEEVVQILISSNADVIAVPELATALQHRLKGPFLQIYPYAIEFPGDHGNFGIGLYSKYPLEQADSFVLNDERITSIEASVVVAGRKYMVVATHTLPPVGHGAWQHRNEHLRQLAARIGKVVQSSPELDVIVLGDLNLTPWSPTFSDFCGDSGLTRAGGTLKSTWYRLPFFPFALCLDHVLASSNLICRSHNVSADAGSDHRMVTVELNRRYPAPGENKDLPTEPPENPVQ